MTRAAAIYNRKSMNKNLACLMWLLLPVALAGCMRVKGVVLEATGNRPVKTAVLTVGRPDGIAVYSSHKVDANGAFDFRISTVDVHNVYVYDGAAAPELTVQHLTESQLGDDMKIRLAKPPRQEPEMTVPR
jgi:hypothetical protein